MQYKSTKKIMLDQRKLETLFRIGCPDNLIIELLKTGKFVPTGDSLIDDNLETLIDHKIFNNNNWGGKREGAGRPKNNQVENQVKNQVGFQDKNQDTDKDIKQEYNKYNNIYNILNNIGKEHGKKILIDDSFSCSKFDVFKVYIQEMPESVIKSVENWLKKQKNGQEIPVEFIIKQFFNFAKRNDTPIFKEKK